MFNLLFMVTLAQTPIMAFLGSYSDLPSCQNAIREIYAYKINIPGQRNPEFDKTIQLQIDLKKEYLCVPVKKG